MSAYSDSEDNFNYVGLVPHSQTLRRSERQRMPPEKSRGSLVDYQSGSEAGSEENEEERTDAWDGFLNPAIEQILGFDGSRYQVKLRDRSYIHLIWLEEDEILNEGRSGRLKLNRFKRDKLPMLLEDDWFDPTFLEVDRVLYTTEIFPVVHPRQASLVSDRWQGKCAFLLSKIMNFTKDGVPYGVAFFRVLDNESASDYLKMIRYPMDFITIHNRLYNGYYVEPIEFWKDLGFIFKNTQLYFTDKNTDSRVMCDTLRELSILIYKKWYQENTDSGPYTLYWVVPVPGVDSLSPEFIQLVLPASDSQCEMICLLYTSPSPRDS